MKAYRVVFAPEAEDNLVELFEYIAEHAAPTIAARNTDAIVEYCEGLATFALLNDRHRPKAPAPAWPLARPPSPTVGSS